MRLSYNVASPRAVHPLEGDDDVQNLTCSIVNSSATIEIYYLGSDLHLKLQQHPLFGLGARFSCNNSGVLQPFYGSVSRVVAQGRLVRVTADEVPIASLFTELDFNLGLSSPGNQSVPDHLISGSAANKPPRKLGRRLQLWDWFPAREIARAYRAVRTFVQSVVHELRNVNFSDSHTVSLAWNHNANRPCTSQVQSISVGSSERAVSMQCIDCYFVATAAFRLQLSLKDFSELEATASGEFTAAAQLLLEGNAIYADDILSHDSEELKFTQFAFTLGTVPVVVEVKGSVGIAVGVSGDLRGRVAVTGSGNLAVGARCSSSSGCLTTNSRRDFALSSKNGEYTAAITLSTQLLPTIHFVVNKILVFSRPTPTLDLTLTASNTSMRSDRINIPAH